MLKVIMTYFEHVNDAWAGASRSGRFRRSRSGQASAG